MEYDILSGSQDALRNSNSFAEIRTSFDTVLNGLQGNSLEKMKHRCLPTTLEEIQNGGQSKNRVRTELVLFGVIPFSENMLNSPSFSKSEKFSNLIVDNNGVLLQLLFEYDPLLQMIKLSYKLVETTEYRNENGLVARKFERYIK